MSSEKLPLSAPPIVLNVSYPPFDDLVARRGPLETKAWDRLVASGKLPATKIGRREYTRRSLLLALVGAPTSAAEQPSTNDPRGDLAQKLRGEK